jgi:hypothetical protein
MFLPREIHLGAKKLPKPQRAMIGPSRTIRIVVSLICSVKSGHEAPAPPLPESGQERVLRWHVAIRAPVRLFGWARQDCLELAEPNVPILVHVNILDEVVNVDCEPKVLARLCKRRNAA